MSDRKFELEVAENAQRDIIEIRLYSTEVWGDQQADDYLVRLSAGFESLQSNPQLGKSEEDMRLDFGNWWSESIEFSIALSATWFGYSASFIRGWICRECSCLDAQDSHRS